MPDIRFDRCQSAVILLCCAECGKRPFERIHFHHIADDGRCAVGFDHLDGINGIARHLNGFLNASGLPFLARRCNVFALAIAGFAEARDHRINRILIPNRIFKTFQND